MGPPGTGKTEMAKIVGKMYSKLGLLKKNVFRKVTRSDLVAGYLGQTAIKTRKVIDECLGGVLFIDEAYSLGNAEGRDSFAKEAIDMINQYLSERKKDFMFIVAGYSDDTGTPAIAANPGADDYASSTDLKLQFDALGRTINMIDAVGTTKYTYANGLLASEDGPWASDTITYGHNNARLRS
jgi:hypothetical protein